MPSLDFENLADAQRRTAKALQRLASRLGSSGAAGSGRGSTNPLIRQHQATARTRPVTVTFREELRRLLGPRPATSPSRTSVIERLGAFPRQGLTPVPSERVTNGAERSRQREEDVDEVLQTTARAIRGLGDALRRNTEAVVRNGLSAATGGSLVAGLGAGLGRQSGVGNLFKGGLGLVPLGLKIAGLFGGKKREAQSFSAFELPPSLSLEVANTDNVLNGFPQVARGRSGQVRLVEEQSMSTQPPVVVNITAMDTQSFLARISDLAPLTARVDTLTGEAQPFLHPKEAAAEAGPIEPPSCPSWGLIRRCEVDFADTPPSFRPQYTDFAFAKCGANHPAQAAPRSSAACRQTAAGSDVPRPRATSSTARA